MIQQPRVTWFFFLYLTLLLASCGGSGGSLSSSSEDGSLSQGIAVDPYIEGAVFQEIDPATGVVLQRQSSPSDEFGRFTFPRPLTPGSVIEMKISNKGMHGPAPYQGMLRRAVHGSDSEPLVVSPLTTLLANGASENDIISLFRDAGLTGLTTTDLYDDPMQGLSGASSGITNQHLIKLQAAMAANAYMEATGNFLADWNDLNDYEQFQVFRSMVGAMENLLNADEFAYIIESLSDDPGVTDTPNFNDFILAVLEQKRNIVALAREDMESFENFSPVVVEQAVEHARQNSVANVRLYYRQRVPSSSVFDGPMLYRNHCAGCHGALADTDKPGRSAADIQSAIDNNIGWMGYLDMLTIDEIQAVADALPDSAAPDPAAGPNGTALYGSNCTGCHGTLGSTDIPGRTTGGIQAAINNNIGGMGFLNSLTADEIQAIADVLPAPPALDPATSPNGTALYTSECSGCHGPLASTNKPGRTAAQIQSAIDGNAGGMGFLASLTTAEVRAIEDVLPAPPALDPATSPNGTALYTSECSGCHGPLASTNKPGRTAAQIQSAIDGNAGGMGFLASLTTAEVRAIEDVLPAPPALDPATSPNGTALYTSECSGCHGPLASTNKPGRTAAQIQSAIDGNAGGMGFLASLKAAEVRAIADILPAGEDPGPDYSECTACHGQPPAGNSFPNTDGAHTVHTDLVSIGANCSACHLGAEHNSYIDLGFPADYDAKSGPATDNLDGTCSSVKCHGGQLTPDWWDGTIVVDTQCTSCHSSGTSQYNSYSSGMHRKHVRDKGYSCTVCHNTAKLENGHFINLESNAFELSPAATIGGGSARVGSYRNSTCSSVDCHGSENWFDEEDDDD